MPRLHSSYRNVMEPIAAMELERQIQDLPPDLASRIDRNDALVRTLNRLPPLYATTAAGWDWHYQKVRESLGEDIRSAAAKAILEACHRIHSDTEFTENSPAEADALQDIERLLGCENLSWCDVVAVVSETLHKTEIGKIARHPCQSLHSSSRRRN